MFGSSLPSALGWLVTTKVYSGTGADIVMESITVIDLVSSVNAWLRQLPSPNALCVLRYKRSPGPGQRCIATMVPFNRQPSTLRRNVIGAEPFCWTARISHGEVSYEKTAVTTGAARIGDTVCSKPVRWDLDDQTGHGPVSHQAGPILAE